jgi:hypothetical protein
MGDPVCRINTGGPTQNEMSAVRYAHQRMEQWFREAGAIAVEASDQGYRPLRLTPTAARAWAPIRK